jgi:DNA-binding transcriptional LysR family regulator
MSAAKPEASSDVQKSSSDRLDSWKEIASYLRRDERTVRRWEREGLPVRRHTHKKQASVYAYRSEIDAWWNDGQFRINRQTQAVSSRRSLGWVFAGAPAFRMPESKRPSNLLLIRESRTSSFVPHAPRAFDLELRQLRAFVALVECGSITAASDALHLAQSTVSEAIIALERALGTALISHTRGTQAARLTAAGRALLPHACNVLGAVGTTYVAVAKAVTSARGSLSIIANESISTYLLPRALITMRQRWSNTKFAISVGTCAEVREGIRNGAFDLGLLIEFANHKDRNKVFSNGSNRSEGWQVVNDLVPLVVFAAPGHPLISLANFKPLRKSALDSFPLFISDAAGGFHAVLERCFCQDQPLGLHLESTGSVEAVKRVVVSEPHGLGVLPLYAVAEELRKGLVVCLDVSPSLPQMQLLALISRSRSLHPGMADLLEEMGRVSEAAPPQGNSDRPRQPER